MRQDIDELLQTKCLCGSDLVYNDTLDYLYCPNPKCCGKIGFRLKVLLKALGKDETLENCVQMVNLFKLSTPFQIFMIDPSKIPSTLPNSKNIQSILYSINSKVVRTKTLSEIISLSGIPYIEDNGYSLFHGYLDIHEALNDILDKGNIEFIQDKLNLTGDCGQEVAYRIYTELSKYRKELETGIQKFFYIKPYNKEIIHISIDIDPIDYMSKQQIIDELESLYGDKAVFLDKATLLDDVDILITDAPNSKKSKYAAELNQKYQIQQRAMKLSPNQISATPQKQQKSPRKIREKIAGAIEVIGVKHGFKEIGELLGG